MDCESEGSLCITRTDDQRDHESPGTPWAYGLFTGVGWQMCPLLPGLSNAEGFGYMSSHRGYWRVFPFLAR